MYQTVPVKGLAAGYVTLHMIAAGGSAISPEATVVRESATALMEPAERSQALFGGRAFAISQLIALAVECAEPGWNGENAAAINPRAVRTAERLVRALPDGLPLPVFAPEPDGSISLDWIRSRNRLVSLSVGVNDRLAFAWLEGTDKGHAVARFDGQNVPPLVLERIEGVVGSGHAGLRAA